MDFPTAERDVDLALMRQCFAELMDRAAHLLQCDGLEQDDAEIERLVLCRVNGDDMCREVLVESLTDAERFMQPIASALGGPTKDTDMRIVRLIARVVIDEGAPMSPKIPIV